MTFSATTIYRKYGNGNPYLYLSSVSGDIFDFIDESLTISQLQGGTVVKYKIKAIYDDPPIHHETEYSNTVDVSIKGGDPTKQYSNIDDTINKYNTKKFNFELSDNYPNPFNPSTSISYSIPENAFVTLKIYDVLGNEVIELINEHKEPGNYQIDFNASSVSRRISSGIYYYRLAAGNFTSTKKMILIK